MPFITYNILRHPLNVYKDKRKETKALIITTQEQTLRDNYLDKHSCSKLAQIKGPVPLGSLSRIFSPT